MTEDADDMPWGDGETRTADDDRSAVADRMLRLFRSYEKAYGTYSHGERNELKAGKLEIRSSARTVRGEVNRALWERHLSGEASLGLIPIRDDGSCLWGAIDVDKYSMSHPELVAMIAKRKLPLVVARSKSGGAHLFLFVTEAVPATTMQHRLRDMAALLAVGDSEIFPKQSAVNTGRGDLGSWLNMPYFGGDESDRYAFGDNGLGLTVEQFLDYAESRRYTPADMRIELREKIEQNSEFGDGPPCLQHLAATGFPEGTRNKGLFNLATFAKRKFGNEWDRILERWNYEFFKPPLPSGEVQEIVKGQSKKEYLYTCKDSPLCNHCNSALCQTRKYGVGGDDDFPVIGSMSVLDTNPPLWFLDVDGHRLELRTEDLQNYKMFHKVCMEQLRRCFRMLKQDTWFKIVSTAMRNAIPIDAPPEVGVTGQFNEHLREFLTGRYRGDRVEDLWLGKPWEDQDGGRFYFRMMDLERHLVGSNFREYNRSMIATRIRDLKGERFFFNIKGRGINVWYVPNDLEMLNSQMEVPPAPVPTVPI